MEKRKLIGNGNVARRGPINDVVEKGSSTPTTPSTLIDIQRRRPRPRVQTFQWRYWFQFDSIRFNSIQFDSIRCDSPCYEETGPILKIFFFFWNIPPKSKTVRRYGCKVRAKRHWGNQTKWYANEMQIRSQQRLGSFRRCRLKTLIRF